MKIFQKFRLDLGLYIPHIKSKGRYEVNGQVLLLPILSNGEFIAEFSELFSLKIYTFLYLKQHVSFILIADINAIAKIYGKQVIKNNDAFMQIEKMVVDFVMKGARFKVRDNLNLQLSKPNLI